MPAVDAQMARILVGAVELIAAVLLIIAGSTGLAVVGAIVVILIMIGAVATHARIGDPTPKMVPAAALGILGVLLLILV